MKLSPLIYVFTGKSLDLFCMMFVFFREHVVVTHVYPMWIDTFALNIFIHKEVIRLIFLCSLCYLGNMYLLV